MNKIILLFDVLFSSYRDLATLHYKINSDLIIALKIEILIHFNNILQPAHFATLNNIFYFHFKKKDFIHLIQIFLLRDRNGPFSK